MPQAPKHLVTIRCRPADWRLAPPRSHSCGSLQMLFLLSFRIINQLLPVEVAALPGSWYLVRKLVELKKLDSYEWHVCDNECCSWEPLPPDQWDSCDDACTTCDKPRFKVVSKNGKVERQPHKVCWVWGFGLGIRWMLGALAACCCTCCCGCGG